MSDVPTHGKGVQAYRWMVGIATAGTAFLAMSILATVRETAKDVTVLQVDVSTVKALQTHQTSRIEAVERRNDEQDRKLDEVRRDVWRFSPTSKEMANP